MLTLNDYLRDSTERPLGPSENGRWFLLEWDDGLKTHVRRKKLHVKVYPALNVRAEWIEEKGQRFFLYNQFLGGRVAYDWRELRGKDLCKEFRGRANCPAFLLFV